MILMKFNDFCPWTGRFRPQNVERRRHFQLCAPKGEIYLILMKMVKFGENGGISPNMKN